MILITILFGVFGFTFLISGRIHTLIINRGYGFVENHKTTVCCGKNKNERDLEDIVRI